MAPKECRSRKGGSLGGKKASRSLTGWRVVDQLLNEEASLPFKWFVHSQNPVGRMNIENFLRSVQDACMARAGETTASSSTRADIIAALNAKFDAHLADLKAPDLADKLDKLLTSGALTRTKRKAGPTF